jgi:autotransporter-associated beta strand protein
MNKQPTTFKLGALPRFFRATLIAGILPVLSFLSIQSSFAGSATWKTSPATGDWNTASNWSPATVPNSSADTATFATSNKTAISASNSVNGIVFNAGASAFTIAGAIGFGGVGITNNSGITQNFSGSFGFGNSATAGSQTNFTIISSAGFSGSSSAGNGTFTLNGGTVSGFYSGSRMQFIDTSTAGNGTFTNSGGAVSGAGGGDMLFFHTSTAGSGTFTNNGSAVSGAYGGRMEFRSGGSPTAANAIITNNGSAFSGTGGGFTYFTNASSAGNSTLIANGGSGGGEGGWIIFAATSHGGTARVEVFGNGTLFIDNHENTGVTTGSIEGDGKVSLGTRKLTVGTNNLSTTFSGKILDHGFGGSLTKTGKGQLTLSKASTYTGGTTVSKGTLLVKNKTGSATGTGAVQVNGGKLGGTGTIAGAVTVGTGSGTGAFLSPGNSATKPGTLTIQKTVTFNSDSTYSLGLNSSRATADEVVAQGVTINSGAQVFFFDSQPSALTPGTVFTVIKNTSASPIAGTFSNLADGATFTNNGNSYKVNYQGGDGNDLTLKVVP